MSKLSAVSRHVTKAGTKQSRPGVILFSLLFLAIALLQGCGNKGDLYRESDAAAIDGLQEAAGKLRNPPSETGTEVEVGDKDEENSKKPVKKNNQNTAPGN